MKFARVSRLDILISCNILARIFSNINWNWSKLAKKLVSYTNTLSIFIRNGILFPLWVYITRAEDLYENSSNNNLFRTKMARKKFSSYRAHACFHISYRKINTSYNEGTVRIRGLISSIFSHFRFFQKFQKSTKIMMNMRVLRRVFVTERTNISRFGYNGANIREKIRDGIKPVPSYNFLFSPNCNTKKKEWKNKKKFLIHV